MLRVRCEVNWRYFVEDDLSHLTTMSEAMLDKEDKAVDPSFDLDSSMKCDVDHLIESFCED